jgi:UDP-glucuronate decarboxylase
MTETPADKILCNDLSHIFNQFGMKDWLTGSRILLTGCAGFLGYSFMHFFTRYFEELKIKSLIGLDNFILERPRWINDLKNRNASHIHIYQFDIAKDDVTRIDTIADCDIIIHMASIASPTYYRMYPIETVDANIGGLRKLLENFKNRSIRKFLFFSSSEIYGNPPLEFIPTPEQYLGNTASIGPRACYDEAKRFGETLCYIYSQQFNMPITIVRPFNNYGPGMRLNDKRVPADFTKAVVENRDIVMYSDGSPTRTFCYVADAVAGYLQALTYDAKFEYFNIGIEKPEISVKELADIFIKQGQDILGYKGRAIFEKSAEKEYLTHNPSRRCPNIKKARELLNYNPSIEVSEGVGRMLEFYGTSKGEL